MRRMCKNDFDTLKERDIFYFLHRDGYITYRVCKDDDDKLYAKSHSDNVKYELVISDNDFTGYTKNVLDVQEYISMRLMMDLMMTNIGFLRYSDLDRVRKNDILYTLKNFNIEIFEKISKNKYSLLNNDNMKLVLTNNTLYKKYFILSPFQDEFFSFQAFTMVIKYFFNLRARMCKSNLYEKITLGE